MKGCTPNELQVGKISRREGPTGTCHIATSAASRLSAACTMPPSPQLGDSAADGEAKSGGSMYCRSRKEDSSAPSSSAMTNLSRWRPTSNSIAHACSTGSRARGLRLLRWAGRPGRHAACPRPPCFRQARCTGAMACAHGLAILVRGRGRWVLRDYTRRAIRSVWKLG